jgi:hypothetical protein
MFMQRAHHVGGQDSILVLKHGRIEKFGLPESLRRIGRRVIWQALGADQKLRAFRHGMLQALVMVRTQEGCIQHIVFDEQIDQPERDAIPFIGIRTFDFETGNNSRFFIEK